MSLFKDKKLWLGLAFSALFLYLAARKVAVPQLLECLKTANYLYLLPAVLFGMASYALRALRWQVLLRAFKPVPFTRLFSAVMIGMLANNVLPARLGEVVRAVLLGQKESLPKSTALATILFERVLDGVVALGMVFTPLLFLSVQLPSWFKSSLWAATGLTLAALVFLFLFRFRMEATQKWLQGLLRLLPARIQNRAAHLLNAFIQGLASIKTLQDLILTLILSLAIWLPLPLGMHFILAGMDISLPLATHFFVLGLICIGVMIPSAPGYVGTIQFICVAGLGLFGVPDSEALTYSIFYHASQHITIWILGAIFLVREGLFRASRGLGSLRDLSRQEPTA